MAALLGLGTMKAGVPAPLPPANHSARNGDVQELPGHHVEHRALEGGLQVLAAWSRGTRPTRPRSPGRAASSAAPSATRCPRARRAPWRASTRPPRRRRARAVPGTSSGWAAAAAACPPPSAPALGVPALARAPARPTAPGRTRGAAAEHEGARDRAAHEHGDDGDEDRLGSDCPGGGGAGGGAAGAEACPEGFRKSSLHPLLEAEEAEEGGVLGHGAPLQRRLGGEPVAARRCARRRPSRPGGRRREPARAPCPPGAPPASGGRRGPSRAPGGRPRGLRCAASRRRPRPGPAARSSACSSVSASANSAGRPCTSSHSGVASRSGKKRLYALR